MKDAIRRVVEDNTSYRRVSDRLGASPATIFLWVDAFGLRAKTPLEIAKELRPQWGGILQVDCKPVSISGQKATVFVAVDVETHDPFHFDLVPAEDQESARRFLRTIKEVLQYPARGIVTDLGKGRLFVGLMEQLFPQVPHQACVIHFLRYVHTRLPRSTKSAYYQQNEFLRFYFKELLCCSSHHNAEKMFLRLIAMEPLFPANYHKTIFRSLKKNFQLLTAHLSYDHLPRDTNVVENVIKQLNMKLKLLHGFKTHQSAYRFLKLWFCAYRFRPFRASQKPSRNGKSPLNLAGVKTQGIDWLEYCQRTK